MKKTVLLLITLFFFVASCKDSIVAKPNNLLDEDQMVSIIYDLSLLDALRNQNSTGTTKYPTPTKFLEEKYKIDSSTFAKNTQYYAADIVKYKKIYQKVKSKLDADNEKLNGKKKELPMDVGVVK